MKKTNLFLTLFFLLFFNSCANYIDSLHRGFDKEQNRKNGLSRANSYRPPRRNYRRSRSNQLRNSYAKNPVKSINHLNSSTQNQRREQPSDRDYQERRYKAVDFQDQQKSGSLWADQGSSASLFTYQNDKRKGDLVIINVLEDLRNQISSELKRVFSKPKPPSSETDTEKPKTNETQNANNLAGAGNQDNEVDVKVYDKISGTVIDEVNKDYILLRGLKDVIFRREKRSIEIRALVSRKDIMENDYVNSDKLLESRVVVLRRNPNEND